MSVLVLEVIVRPKPITSAPALITLCLSSGALLSRTVRHFLRVLQRRGRLGAVCRVAVDSAELAAMAFDKDVVVSQAAQGADLWRAGDLSTLAATDPWLASLQGLCLLPAWLTASMADWALSPHSC